MIHVQLKDGNDVSDYLIPFDRMPQNLTKKDKEILSSFKPTSGQGSKTTSAPKMVTMIMQDGSSGQIPSDKVGEFLKKYPKAKQQ